MVENMGNGADGSATPTGQQDAAVHDQGSAFLVSAVIATYNVARYLPAFLDSLAAQAIGIANVQLVFVDDGSTDGGHQIIRDWAVGREHHVVVLAQENRWVAEARNAGLEHAVGEWITFTDPDDVLDEQYFTEVFKFIALYGDSSRDEPVNLLAAHQMRLLESGEIRDNHPQRRKFGKGSRIVNLHADPIIQLSVNSSFMRRSLIQEHGLRFDDRVRPNFEDGHFIARYMLLSRSDRTGLMASAKYLYRTRGDGSSLLEKSFRMREKYTAVLEHGYLDVLRLAGVVHDAVPRWVENTVLYDLFWYFKEQLAVQSLSAAAPLDVLPRFHELVGEIRALIADDAIRSFDLMHVEFAVRQALLRGYSGEPIRQDYVRLSDVDEGRQQVKVSYWFSGPLPEEVFEVDGLVVEPTHETVRDYTFYGQTLIRERHLWFERGQRTKIRLDGTLMQVTRGDVVAGPEGLTNRQINPAIMGIRRQVRDRFAPGDVDAVRHGVRRLRQSWRKTRRNFSKSVISDEILEFSLKTSRVRSRYEHAWVFMDRDTDANDNAEHLYRWVRDNRPDINAWFVLSEGSADWSRLHADGFRLVAHGSWQWKMLLLHADHLASSHADAYVTQPLNQRRYGRSRFRYTFLQHGVIHNDLSRWLSWKKIDVFVTTTPTEFEAIAGHGPYSFSSHEVVLTGLPRHDALLRRRQAVDAEDRDLILVMPTWRQGLLGERVEGSNKRLPIKDFGSSEYAKRYRALLASDTLRDLAAQHGKTLAFMPHPNMRAYLDEFDLPSDVRILDFSRDNVQDVLAKTAMFVTDYSSLAFDAAYLDIPLVYFQFDRASFFDGTHVGRQGYFDFTRHGFGPVEQDEAAVISALEAHAAAGFTNAAPYAERVRETFAFRDGANCERVVAAMEALDHTP